MPRLGQARATGVCVMDTGALVLASEQAVHSTGFCYAGDADPSAPGGISAVYQDLVADEARTIQVAGDVAAALLRGRNCLVHTKWIAHLDRLAAELRERGHDPVVLRGGMGAKARAAALKRLHSGPGDPPLLVVATGPYIGEGFDCPALDTLFLVSTACRRSGSNRTGTTSEGPLPSIGRPRRRDLSSSTS